MLRMLVLSKSAIGCRRWAALARACNRHSLAVSRATKTLTSADRTHPNETAIVVPQTIFFPVNTCL